MSSSEIVLPPTPYGTAAEAAPVVLGTGSAAPRQLSNQNGVSRYMAVLERVAVRATPSSSARVVARLSTRTPEGTTNVVLALSRVERSGTLWIKARLPVLPNNTTGWIKRDSLGGYNVVNTHLVVSTTKFTATLYRLGRPVFTARVGVGRSRWPTPTGRFYIRNKLTKYSSPTYGPLAFGTSARSAVLTDWPAGGFVGIHGTNQPGLIPGRISHGCIRLRNADILRLAALMAPGTPLTVV
ncbi:MAG: L,D-transpeptidase [Gaiellaceae bacterium]